MDAAINSETPVTAYMNMPVLRFYETWQAICAVCERRAKAANERAGQAKGRRPRKAGKRRR